MKERMNVVSIMLALLLGLTACNGGSSSGNSNNIIPPVDPAVLKQSLGEKLFFDSNLSTPAGQSCASCHDPASGFADPDTSIPVSQGVLPERFGSRNAPTVTYASFTPDFHQDPNLNYVGGLFIDGRSSNLTEQAKQPFLNPLEMANPDKTSVILAIRASEYADLFEQVYGAGSLDDVEAAFDQVVDALSVFEHSDELNSFTSKFDYFRSGEVQLSTQELSGFNLFIGKGQCMECHVFPLLTDFSYKNIGVPKNPDNPFYNLPSEFNPDGGQFVDLGLGANPGVLQSSESGKFKVPTLRNVAITPPYMHNGALQTLEQVVEFYNTRDILPVCPTDTIEAGCWPAPEVTENVDTRFMGNLGLTNQEISDIVAFMQTLTDGYMLTSP